MNTIVQQIKKFRFLALGLTLTLAGLLLFQNFTDANDLTQPGAENSMSIAKGQVMGTCMYAYDASFSVTASPAAVPGSVIYPMLSCTAAGQATCAPGFELISETPVQMNCSTSPNLDLQNCYWKEYRCVSTSGSTRAEDFIRGEEYGGVLATYDANYSITQIESIKWPMTRFDSNGATCAAGFAPVKSAPVQMNCATNPSKYNVSNCYWMTTRCMKL
ncbi:MAG: hypothetical protein H7061_10120 [Bdellovibrionaceae bacterium]|nr:hypothetical protein [Bdellovibrio sp.]